MGLKSELEAARKQLAERIRAQQASLAEAKRELNRKQAELDAQDLPLHNSLARANSPLPSGDVCPNCWIVDGLKTPMTSQSSSDDSDIFRCPRCHYEVSFLD